MRRVLALLALFAAFSSASAGDAPAPPPTKSRLRARDPWKSGETTTESGTYRQKIFADVPLGARVPTPMVVQVDYTVVRRCHEVDAAGHWRRGEAWFRRWIRVSEKASDRSLEGAFVDVDRDGTWKVAESKTSPSSDAQKWAEKFLSEGGAASGDGDGGSPDDEPSGELVVGATTSVRATQIERTLAGFGYPIPANGLSSNFTLVSIDAANPGPRITYTHRIDASLVGSGTWNGAAAKYLSGSAFHARAEVKKALGACHASMSLHVDHDFVCVVDAGDGPIRGESIYNELRDRSPGGDIPERKPPGGK